MKKEDSIIVNSKSHSEWMSLIQEWVHNEVDRKMLVRYLLDGVKLGPLAEEFDISTVHCQHRVDAAKKQLFKHI
jgi:hypothetical protein